MKNKREIKQEDVAKMQYVLNKLKYLKADENYYQERFNLLRQNSIDVTLFSRATVKFGYFREKGTIGMAKYYECLKVGNFEPLEARKVIELLRQWQREIKKASVAKINSKTKQPTGKKQQQVNIKTVTIDSKKELSFLWGLFKFKY